MMCRLVEGTTATATATGAAGAGARQGGGGSGGAAAGGPTDIERMAKEARVCVQKRVGAPMSPSRAG